MRLSNRLIIFLLPIFISANFIDNLSCKQIIEKYTYIEVPKNAVDNSQNEIVKMELIHDATNTICTSVETKNNGKEIIKIGMHRGGNFVSASSENIDSNGKLLKKEEIWRDNQNVFVSRKGKIKKIKMPADIPLDVDASLLINMRMFPFEKKGIVLKVFMVDFSGSSIFLEIRNAGEENIIVPGGGFLCYKMEAIINLYIFHPKITFWITKNKPHFLVKHMGKKGPFTKSYTTSLVS